MAEPMFSNEDLLLMAEKILVENIQQMKADDAPQIRDTPYIKQGFRHYEQWVGKKGQQPPTAVAASIAAFTKMNAAPTRSVPKMKSKNSRRQSMVRRLEQNEGPSDRARELRNMALKLYQGELEALSEITDDETFCQIIQARNQITGRITHYHRTALYYTRQEISKEEHQRVAQQYHYAQFQMQQAINNQPINPASQLKSVLNCPLGVLTPKGGRSRYQTVHMTVPPSDYPTFSQLLTMDHDQEQQPLQQRLEFITTNL